MSAHAGSEGSTTARVASLIMATSGVQLANGFFQTFISLRISIEHFDATLAGLILSSYFAGYTFGAIRCAPLIQRIGFIRSYVAFAGMVIAATAAMPLLVNAWTWLFLRSIIGFGCAGLFVTTESWLNAKAEVGVRGRIFSYYMFGTFLALALGQLLIIGANVETAGPFGGITAIFATSLVIVAMTRADPPPSTEPGSLAKMQLFRGAPVAVVGCGLNGLITGAFYALVPAWMQGVGVDRTTIGLCMLSAVLGGLLFQIPVGLVSDRFDRRIVLSILGIGVTLAALALIYSPRSLFVILPLSGLFGGFMSTLYPVCVAHAHDRMPNDRIVAVSGRLILVNGIGAIVGPFLGMQLMTRFEIDGLFFMIASAAVLLSIVSAGRTLTEIAPKRLSRPFDLLTPQAGRLAHGPKVQLEQETST